LILGRFLEISLHAPAIQDSLAFYESLGFVQATVGETWPHPYAVVTDGRLFLGLHGAPIASPALTFVAPQLLQGVDQLEAQGVEFDELHLGEEVFNRAAFRDPSGLIVNLLEARTFSPPQLENPAPTTCGYFSELGIPVREAEAARRFWEPLGFVALEEELRPFARTALTSDRLNLALYRSRALRAPVLTFEDEHMRERIARLRERSYTVTDEMPDSLDDACNAVLIAPEGTRLLLLEATA
jgi:catechol 2,3-dioxygenase-like lactoylglutathione lyase family enzyme